MMDDSGQKRVKSMEMNNRNTSAAKGDAAKTPRKMGVTKGFTDNKTKNGKIFGKS